VDAHLDQRFDRQLLVAELQRTDLGVLDSDLYASLPAGNYVIYSGVYDSKADADKLVIDYSTGMRKKLGLAATLTPRPLGWPAPPS